MKKYGVSIPVAGYVYKEVEAESKEEEEEIDEEGKRIVREELTKEEALEKAFDEGYKDDEIAELDMYDVLVEGSVCYTYHTKVEVEEIED